MGLSREELIKKLESISALFHTLVAIKTKMDNYTPEDHYERTVIVPVFPGDKNEWLQSSVDHCEEDAVEQMGEAYDRYLSPKKPTAPAMPKYVGADNQAINNKVSNLGCGSYFAIGVSIFFLLGSLVGVDKSTADALPTILAIAAIAAGVFVVLRMRIKGLRAQAAKAEAEAKAKYDEKIAGITAEYNAALRNYEKICAAYEAAKQDFLEKYKAWRSIYLKSVEEENDIAEKLEADRVAAVEKINAEEYAPLLREMEKVNDLVSEDYLPVIDIIIDLIKSGRADDLKEAINLYEDIVYRERQLELEREKEAQRRYEEELRRRDEERHHKEQMKFQQDQERQRQREEEQRQRDAERRHREDMAARERQERDRQLEENRRREEERRRQEREKRDREQEESRAIRRQCNSCALSSKCSVAFSRPNCASFTPI